MHSDIKDTEREARPSSGKGNNTALAEDECPGGLCLSQLQKRVLVESGRVWETDQLRTGMSIVKCRRDAIISAWRGGVPRAKENPLWVPPCQFFCVQEL